MRSTGPLWAIFVALCSVSVGGSQGGFPTTLSAEMRAHVQSERFGIVTSLRGLPLGVRGALQTLFGTGTLDIAEPGGDFQLTDMRVNAPSRQLMVAGCSYEHCLVYY